MKAKAVTRTSSMLPGLCNYEALPGIRGPRGEQRSLLRPLYYSHADATR